MGVPTAYTAMASQNVSKKRKFVADGVFYAELNELLVRELAEDGYSGVEVRQTPARHEIIIRATRTQNVLGEKGRRIRELTAVVQKRFNFPAGSVELYAEKVLNRGLCAVAQAESLRYKLLGGLAVRRACYGVLRLIMESGALGCEVIVSGKLRAQRAKSMKFQDGYMIKAGNPCRHFIDSAVRHVCSARVCWESRSTSCCRTILQAEMVLRSLCLTRSTFSSPRRMSLSSQPKRLLLLTPCNKRGTPPGKLLSCSHL